MDKNWQWVLGCVRATNDQPTTETADVVVKCGGTSLQKAARFGMF